MEQSERKQTEFYEGNMKPFVKDYLEMKKS
jgi:hypothetical protein